MSAEESENGSQEDDDIECVHNLLTAVKDLVAYLKRTGHASMLKSTVIQECVTRWNTKLAVLIIVHKAFSEIESLLQEKNQEERLEGIDISLMEDLINFLMPFKHISDAMEGDKYPTLHCVLLWKRKLLDHCKFNMSDSKIIHVLKSRVDSVIQEKWIDYKLYKIALFLFPKFKSMSILTETNAQGVPDMVRLMLKEKNFQLSVDNEVSTEADCTIHLAPRHKKPKMCLGVEYALELNEYADTVPECDTDEVTRYIQANFSSEASASQKHHSGGGGGDVLKFWMENQSTYPKLSKLARWVLSVPASSASSERVFSCAGRVFEERRTRLGAESFDDVVFLNSFFKNR